VGLCHPIATALPLADAVSVRPIGTPDPTLEPGAQPNHTPRSACPCPDHAGRLTAWRGAGAAGVARSAARTGWARFSGRNGLSERCGHLHHPLDIDPRCADERPWSCNWHLRAAQPGAWGHLLRAEWAEPWPAIQSMAHAPCSALAAGLP